MIADLRGLYEEFVVYRNEDAPRLLHAFKAALAVVLSMLISMRLERRSPGTAMVSGDFNRFLSLVIVDFGTGIRVAAPTSVLSSMTLAGTLLRSAVS